MSDSDFQEKTEKGTSRQREKAREEGKVVKSAELNAAVTICLGFLTLYMFGPYLAEQITRLMSHTMMNAPTIAMADAGYVKIFGDSMQRFFLIMLPLFVVFIAIALGSNIAQIGFKITPKSMEPKLDKLDLIKGAKRLVSMRSAVTLVRDTTKLTVIGIVAYFAIKAEFAALMLLPDMAIGQILIAMGTAAVTIAMKIGGVVFLIAVLDYMYQKYEFEKSIKMTKQQLKEEYKDTEGNPQLKARVRQVQREMAQNRQMKAVPTADVVITNPTHLAVALKYDPESTGSPAPIVIAKGERLIAKRIKQLAIDSGIPVVEDRPLARALFKMCDVGQTVPSSLYRAIAELLAYVYRLKGKVTV